MARRKLTSAEEFEPYRERFEGFVSRREPDECWPWVGKSRNGEYGSMSVSGWPWLSNRLAWILANKRMPKDGAYICHTCDNRACCNPAHLYEGTPKSNMRDCRNRKRWKRVKLTPEQVIEIAESSEPVKWLSERFGVGSSCITNIKYGVTWSDLTEGRRNTSHAKLGHMPRDVARSLGYGQRVAA